MRFAPQGLRGLIEQMAAGFFQDGQLNRMLWDKTLDGLVRHVASSDRITVERAEGDTGVAKAADVVRALLDRGVDLIRLHELILFQWRIRHGEQKLELEHGDLLRQQMIELVESKGLVSDMRRQLILTMTTAKELFDELRGLLVGEAKRLLGGHVKREHLDPPTQALAWIDEAMERTMIQLTLNLELMPDFHGIIERLGTQGGGVSQEELERYVAWAANDPARQIGVAAARRGMATRQGQNALEEVPNAFGDLHNKVRAIRLRLPERLHEETSDKITPLRRSLQKFDSICKESPTHPKQLGALAMVLVRLDRCAEYESLLEELEWMGEYAVGELVKAGLNSFYTPGLLRVIDEIGPQSEPIGTNALAWALKLTGEASLEVMIIRRSVSG